MQPTAEQEAIIQAAATSTTSIMVQAYAGCAKTTTLELLAKVLPKVPTLAVAFNVKIKKELEKRFPSHFEVKTLNGLGHVAWAKAIGRNLRVEDRKVSTIVRDQAKAQGRDLGDEWSNVMGMIRQARHVGLVPDGTPGHGLVPDNEDQWLELTDLGSAKPWVLQFARACLVECIRQSYEGLIDFDDQIYMSTLFGGVFPKFKILIVDEAQDLSPLNHIQISKCAIDRLIIVGDPKQAIYAFRGADSSSMAKLKALRPEWIELPLHQTFRCPKAIVARQQDHAPGFRSHESNREGGFWNWFLPVQDKQPLWSMDRIREQLVGDLPVAPSIAMLCRNNAPLLAMAFKLLRSGVGCVMLGRDIGKNLIKLSTKIAPDDLTPAAEVVQLVADWALMERSAAAAKEDEAKIAAIADREECLYAVLEFSKAETAGDLRAALASLFARDTGLVTLATGHRSKGLEWDLVIHLDPWRVPSKWARAQADRGFRGALEQELNLRYVIETRTKHTLVLANVEDFQ